MYAVVIRQKIILQTASVWLYRFKVTSVQVFVPKPKPGFLTHASNEKGCHVHASQAVAACHLIPPKIDKNMLKLNSSIYMK